MEKNQTGVWSRQVYESKRFANRQDAGRKLGAQLDYLREDDPVVLGLARGGVVIAAEIAKALDAPLQPLVARKLGAPHQPELGIGAIAPNGMVALNEDLIFRLGITREEIEELADRELAEVNRRLASYTEGWEPVPLNNRVVIVADDGLATGFTAIAAVRYVRSQQPKRIVLAVPVCSTQAAEMLRHEADEIVCLELPDDLMAVGYWYEDFAQTTDEEVLDLLNSEPTVLEASMLEEVSEIRIPLDDGFLYGDLTIPVRAKGAVIFAHGSGSSRHSSRNRVVAEQLNYAGFATLLMDLLTPEEEQVDLRAGHLRFDVGLLAERLRLAAEWAAEDKVLSRLPTGLFGASTGAAAALLAATALPGIKAIVSRGGRPDLADQALPEVRAATLLIVGERDEPIIDMNRAAFRALGSPVKRMEIVPDATHLFPEPGALEEVARLASAWFGRYLG